MIIMWNIKPDHKETYNCFQDMVAILASYYNKEYYMMFLELWGFKYNKVSSRKIGDNLELCWKGNLDRRRRLLNNFHGINFEIIRIREIENQILFIENQLQKSPVGVYFDAYECWWNSAYNKMHLAHYCLIIDNDIDNQEFICIDQFCKENEVIRIPHEEIKHISKDYMVFTIRNISSIDKKMYINALDECIQSIEDNCMFIQYKLFINDMLELFDIKVEVNNENDLNTIALFRKLKNLSSDRQNLMKALVQISKKTNLDFNLIIVRIKEIVRSYESLRSVLIKSTFRKKDINKEKLKNLLQGIYDKEFEVYSCMKKILFSQKNK